MHRCLLISEIVTHILEYSLSDGSLAAPNTGDAAAMALTCRTLLEPSLDVVWYELHSIEPLLDIVSTWDHLDSDDDTIEMIQQPIRSRDWQRLDYYARRIRILNTLGNLIDDGESDGTAKLSDDLFLAITVYHPASRIVLSNLRELTWEVREPNDLLKMNICLGPYLKSLKLDIYPFEKEFNNSSHVTIAAAIAQLKMTCPLLEEVSINSYDPFVDKFMWLDEVQEVFQVICALPSVAHLAVTTYLTCRDFYHISQMHSLRKLSARFKSGLSYESYPLLSELQFRPFSAIEDLDFVGADVFWFVQLLKAMNHCDLAVLHLVDCPKRDIIYINDLFRAMNKYCDHTMLKDFYLYLSKDGPEEDDTEGLLADNNPATVYENIFKPLSVFSNMTTIQFFFESDPPVITDATLGFFAISFPLLKHFELDGWAQNLNNVQTTIIGLASFKNCTYLMHLKVSIGSVIVDHNDGAITRGPGTPSTLVWQININKIQKSKIQASHLDAEQFIISENISPISVALFLLQTFPGITNINIPQVQNYIDNKDLIMKMVED